jgi:hypothetical protein
MLLVGGVLLAGCGQESKTYEIAPQKVPCRAMGPWLCLEATEVETGERLWLYEGIEGFEFRWGVTQTVKLRIETLQNPPQDSSGQRWHLVETLDRMPVPPGTTFELALTNEYLTGTQPAFFLLNSEPLDCTARNVCNALAQHRGGPPEGALTLVLSPTSSEDVAHIVESVR